MRSVGCTLIVRSKIRSLKRNVLCFQAPTRSHEFNLRRILLTSTETPRSLQYRLESEHSKSLDKTKAPRRNCYQDNGSYAIYRRLNSVIVSTCHRSYFGRLAEIPDPPDEVCGHMRV